MANCTSVAMYQHFTSEALVTAADNELLKYYPVSKPGAKGDVIPDQNDTSLDTSPRSYTWSCHRGWYTCQCRVSHQWAGIEVARKLWQNWRTLSCEQRTLS